MPARSIHFTAGEDWRKPEPPSDKDHLAALFLAVAYAKAAQTQPSYVRLAKKRNLTAYSVALADAMHPPRVITIDASQYTGRAGSMIRVQAEDDVQVARVRVTISDAANRVLEEGDAVSDQAGRWWTYRPQTDRQGVMIQATAFDLAGNTGSATVVIDGAVTGK